MNRQKISEGICFTVKTEEETVFLGVVARHSKDANLIAAYFFHERPLPVDLEDFGRLRSVDALAAFRIGRKAFDIGRWNLEFVHPRWVRCHWPMPKFFNGFGATLGGNVAIYDDNDPSKFLRYEDQIDFNPHFEDGASGYNYVEERLRVFSNKLAP